MQKILLGWFVVLVSAAGLTLVSAPAGWAEAPPLMSYQGKLADAAGNPVTGQRRIGVSIFDAPGGGSLLFQEITDNVKVSNGVFTLVFGNAPSAGSLPGALRSGTDRWLEISVNPGLAGAEVFAPRQRLVSAPYAQAVAGGSVGASEIADGSIADADVSSSAGIAASKVAGGVFAGASDFVFPTRVAVGSLFSPSYTLHVTGQVGLTQNGNTGELKVKYTGDPTAPGYYATYAP